MRSFDDILTDICVSFDSNINEFKNRSLKRTTEHMSLINQAFIATVLFNCCVNMTYVAKYLNRSVPSVSKAYNKTLILLKMDNSLYAQDFKERLQNSCEEGKKLVEYYKK